MYNLGRSKQIKLPEYAYSSYRTRKSEWDSA